jgi:quinol monooxygenase YgiN
MAQKPLTIIAQVQAHPGKEAELLAAQKELAAGVVKEPGCLRYELHVSNEKTGRTMFLESWETFDLWQDHMKAPALMAFRAKAGHLVAETILDQMTPDL